MSKQMTVADLRKMLDQLGTGHNKRPVCIRIKDGSKDGRLVYLNRTLALGSIAVEFAEHDQ